MLPYHLHSFLGGQSNYEDKGIAGAFKFGQALDIRKIKDTLSCQQALIDDLAIGTMTALCKFIVIADDNQTYFFCADGKIYRRTSGGVYDLMYTEASESGNIIGAAQWYDNAGNIYLLYATPTRLNIKIIIGSGYVNTEPWNDVNTVPTGSWPKTNLTSSAWHTMRICNGALLLCNDSTPALVGFDMSYTNNALQLIPGNQSITLVERGIYSVIGTNRKNNNIEESSLYEWDGLALDWNNKQIFKVKGVNAMIDTEYALMQVGNNGLLYNSDTDNPMPYQQFFGGGQCYPDGVDSDRGLALFGVFGNSSGYNGIWTYGRLQKNAPPVLNFEYFVDCDVIGSVKKIGTNIFIAYQKGITYGVKKLDFSAKAPAIYQSLDLVTPLGTRRYPINLQRNLNWGKINLQMAPLPAGCAVEAWYRLDKLTTLAQVQSVFPSATPDANGWIQATQPDSQGGRLSTAGTERADFNVAEISRVCEVMVKLFPFQNTTPEIHEVNVYFDVG